MPCLLGTNRARLFGATNFLPTQISGLALWLRPESLSGTPDGTSVSSWMDDSGNTRNATQAVAGSRPLFKTNILNGRPVVRFDGVDDLLQTAGFNLVQPENVYFVASVPIGSNGTIIDGISGNTMRVFQPDATNDLRIYAGAFGPLVVPTTGFHVFGILYSGASSYARVDGGSESDADPGAGSPDGVTLGAFGNGAAAFALTDIAEIVIYNRALGVGERSAVEHYLGTKYGIAVS